jgi:PPM family protein phosphatase
MIELAAISDVGMVRSTNEDAWDALPEQGLFVLADGMGGHRAGEVASRHAVSAICRFADSQLTCSSTSSFLDIESLPLLLTEAVETANREIFAMGWEEPSLRGMGTTLCVLCWQQGVATWAHVGDSRIYFWNGTHLIPLTQDHTVVAELAEAGLSSSDLQEMGVSKNLLTRAVGTTLAVEVETGQMATRTGCFVLCTDGLLEGVSEEELARALKEHGVSAHDGKQSRWGGDLTGAAQELVRLAKANRSHDNITLLLIQSEGQEGDLPRPQRDDST